MKAEIPNAGHFQFLDEPNLVQRSVCSEGKLAGGVIKGVSRAVMIAFADTMLENGEGRDDTNLLDSITESIHAIKTGLKEEYRFNDEEVVSFQLKGPFYSDEFLRGLTT